MKYKKAFAFLATALIGAVAFGAALTDDRDTPARTGELQGYTQASNTIYAGSLVALNSLGLAVPASDTAGYIVVGRAKKRYDNTGANYSATAVVEIERGTFRYANGGAFTNGNVGDFCYALDDQTVFTAALATNDVVAGLVVQVDSSGVWVDTLSVGGQGAVSLASLTVSGAGSIGTTLGVTGNATFSGDIIADDSTGISTTQTIVEVAAGTANATTTTIISVNGIITSVVAP